MLTMGRIATQIFIVLLTSSVFDAEVLIPKIPSLSDMMTSEDMPLLRTVNDVKNYMKGLRDKADTLIADSFVEHTRKYRSVQDFHSFEVSESENFRLAADHIGHYWEEASSYIVIESANITYIVLCTTRNGHQVITDIVHPGQKSSVFKEFHVSPASEEPLDKVTGSIYGKTLWLAFGSTSSNLVNIRGFDLSSKRVFPAPNIPLEGTVSALHMFEYGGKLYLVTGTTGLGISSSSRGAVLYMLLRNYFDAIDALPLKVQDVSDIVGFPDGTSYYLVLALKSTEGTEVYRFSSGMETLKLMQQLPDKESFKVVYFYTQHDSRKWIITLSTSSKPKLYAWERERFTLWQYLSSKTVLPNDSLSVLIIGNSEVVIFLFQRGEINVFLTDHTSHYHPKYLVNTNCSSVRNLESVESADGIVLSYICINENGASEGYKESVLNIKTVVGKSKDYTIQTCLDALDREIEARKVNADHAEKLIPFMMTADGPQEWSTSVDFPHGLYVTGSTDFKDQLILQDHDNVHHELAELVAALKAVEVVVRDIPESNQDILYYNGDQIIDGFIQVPSVTADFANLGTVQFGEVNGVDLLEFPKKFLMNGVYQSIDNDMNIEELNVGEFITRSGTSNSKINDVFMEDFMWKKRKNQVVSGKHTFGEVSCSNVINSEDLHSTLLINQVKTTDLLVRDQAVSIAVPRNLKFLSVEKYLDVHSINKVNLRRLAEKVVYTDIEKKYTLSGSYLFDFINVTGNVDVNSINGVDLKFLDRNVLKKTGDFTLKGILTYENDLVIGEASSVDFINGIRMSNLVDLDSKGPILGKYYIKKAVISEELLCDNINGVDLQRDAVIIDKDQVIKGHIGFAQDVLVHGESGVMMTEGTLINHYDISELGRSLESQAQNIFIKGSASLTNPLTVLHDVKAVSINGIPLEGIQERFWRHSIPQTVEVPVYLDNVEFSDDVLADTLNTYDILDYFNVDKPQTLFGHFYFQAPVTVNGNLDITEGHTFSGIDISDIADKCITLTGKHHITAHLRFEGKLKVDGDLDVGSLNKWRFPEDLMFLDRSQTIHNWTLVGYSRAYDIAADSKLSVKTLNGLNVTVAVEEIAYRDEDAIINSPLFFEKDLHVSEVFVNGKIDGIDLKELLSKTLKKSSETQNITGPIVVKETLDFIGKVEFSEVNNKDWRSHLDNVVQKNYSGEINGVKTFLQPMEVKKNFAPERINNITVVDWYDVILSKSRDQTLTGYYTFTGNFDADTIQSNSINDIDLGNLLLVDKIADTRMNVTFKSNVEFAGGLSTTENMLNGCNMTELNDMSNPTSPNSMRSFYSPMNKDHLHVTGNVTMHSGMIVGTKQFDLKSLLHNLVSKISDEDISGIVTLRDGADIHDLYVESSYGLGVSRLLENSVRDDEDIELDCHIDFQPQVISQKLTVSESIKNLDDKGILVNGVNLSRALSNSARLTNGTFLVHGNVNFTKGFRTDNLHVRDYIDNVRISDLVNLLKTDRVADVVFLSPINIKGNLKVHGLIDGLDLEKEMKNRIMLSTSETLNGNFTFDELMIEGDLEVANINGIQISDLVVKSGRDSQEITGQKTFSHLNVNGNIDASVVDGIDFNQFRNTIVRKDQDMVFTSPVIFMKNVRAAHIVGSTSQVEMESMAQEMKQVNNTFMHQGERIYNLYSSIYADNLKNYGYAQSMFCELAFIEKLDFQNPRRTGEVDFVRTPDHYLVVRGCRNLQCSRESVTSLHKVHNNGYIETIPTEEVTASRFVLSDPSTDIYITIDVLHDDETPQVKSIICAWQQKYPGGVSLAKEIKDLGLVADAEMFMVNREIYIVTVARFHIEGESFKSANITTMKYDISTSSFLTVWSNFTGNSASNLDLIWINGTLNMLVANHHQRFNKAVPFRAISQLYKWQNVERKFALVEQFAGDHVTSGLFMRTLFPVEEVFISFTQLKVADSDIYEEDVRYTREVVIYQYSKRAEVFEAFQFIDAYGIVDQVSFTIDRTLYLLLLSEVKGTLYVFEYIPIEGFHLYQEISIEAGVSLEVIDVKDQRFIVVSTKSLAGLITLSVRTKGLDPAGFTFP
ncbi:uncharacterized protein [Palaemon carinicauda]|uniref:uncharacterized protein n=1 Tax=Palaemon carinicauda TaxID=392227 RepID=UPI0035B688E5